MNEIDQEDRGQDAIERYLRMESATDARDGEVFARCDAVLALTPKLAGSADVAWAFEEARRIARAGPTAATGASWHRSLAVAWSAAAVASMACAALAVAVLWRPEARPAATTPASSLANFVFAPIIVPIGIESEIAKIDSVVLISGQLPVDGRSIAVIPMGGDISSGRAGPIEAAANAVYERAMLQLAALPGLNVIDPMATAPYAATELTPEEIARYLGVRSVIQGEIEYDGLTVRLELRITDAAGAGRSVDRNFARPVAELAQLQGDVTASLLDTLGVAPSFTGVAFQ